MSEHAASAHVAHQFDTAEQQKHASVMGMWIFLVTEIMFFGAVFVAYAVYRGKFGDAFSVGTHLLDLNRGMVNTLILMSSSFTMTLAVIAARQGHRSQITTWLTTTLLLGAAFLVIKGFEYKAKIEHHLVPGPNFHLEQALATHVHDTTATSGMDAKTGDAHFAALVKKADLKQVQMFFSFYFTMTGLHMIHMIIGMGVLVFILRMAQQGRFSPAYYNPLEVTSLYWHFVDMVWIFLFPMLYLLGRH